MTKLLNDVIERLTALPDEEQDAVALIILEELEDERRWDESFSRSQDKLARLADEALAEVAHGGVLPCDPGSQPE